MSDSNWFSDLFIEEAKAAKTTRENMSGEKINNQDKTLTENGEYTFDEGYTGLGVVTVDVPEPDIKEPVFESLSVTENGLYTPPEGVDGYDSVTVNVASSGGSEWEEQFIAAIERDASKPVMKLPEGLTKIGNYAFHSCRVLALTELPAGVTSIGSYAFYDCDNLTLTSLPDGLTSIGSYAFYDCDNLTLTSLPDGLTSISSYAFDDCDNLALTSLPDGVTSIGRYAFWGCDNLALTSLPDGVTSIGSYAFQACPNLALTSMPAGLTKIASSAFGDCRKLTTITFRSKLQSFDSAFYGCTNLHTINVPWAEGEVSGAPWGATNATINYNYVPQPPADKYSWDAVLASIDAGTYATDYAIGDTVPLDLGSEGVINMQIAAFDTDDLADGSGKAHITWIAKELLTTSRRMNAYRAGDYGNRTEGTGSVGGWNKCELRAYLKNTIKPLIPENVSHRIVVVTKTQNAFDTTDVDITQTTEDDVWIPSEPEIKGTNCTYYNLFQNKDEHRKKTKANDTTYIEWWLRSCGYNSADYAFVQAEGYVYYTHSDTTNGVCLCFCT